MVSLLYTVAVLGLRRRAAAIATVILAVVGWAVSVMWGNIYLSLQ